MLKKFLKKIKCKLECYICCYVKKEVHIENNKDFKISYV